MSMIKKSLILVMCFLLIPAVIFSGERPMPPLAVKAAMLVDMNTGRILFQQNSELEQVQALWRTGCPAEGPLRRRGQGLTGRSAE